VSRPPHWESELLKVSNLTPKQMENLHQVYNEVGPSLSKHRQQKRELYKRAVADYPALTQDHSFNRAAPADGQHVADETSDAVSVEEYRQEMKQLNISLKQESHQIWNQIHATLTPEQTIELWKIMNRKR